MTTQISGFGPRKPLRVWPGLVLAALVCVARFLVPAVVPDGAGFAVIGAVLGALAIAAWWLFFSRARWTDRIGALALMAIAVVGTSRIVHASIANGMMGMMLPLFSIPAMAVALAAAAAIGRNWSTRGRRVLLTAAILLACGAFALVRTGGVSGGGASDFHWRWTESPEERLLAQPPDEPATPPSRPADATVPAALPQAPPVAASAPPAPRSSEAKAGVSTAAPTAAVSPALDAAAAAVARETIEWPGFRGPNRDSIVHGVGIATDWSGAPPKEMWRKPIGPGWSSFAVKGGLIYTQEQRGDDEIVACYRASTGEPVWRHRDAVRFWESNGGAGPRATPTLHGRRVFALGATGLLNALDAVTGAVAWSRNVSADAGVKTPGWGFSASPLVVGDTVIAAAAGRLAAYEAATGKPRWLGPPHGGSYSSPHLTAIGGVEQVLLLSDAGLTSVSPGSGEVLWEHTWPGASIVQPAFTSEGDVLVSTAGMSGGIGIRRLAPTHDASGWTTTERWTSNGLKPYFNDMVVHKGHAYGFDGSILACIDLEDGRRKWKGGRYGNGQMILLADQDLLLVLSEEGELALVSAAPDQFKEVARVRAIEGKTWNHPVLVGDRLFVRNGEEMAAYLLAQSPR
jgi:outer membrane protein assembly factor BamB